MPIQKNQNDKVIGNEFQSAKGYLRRQSWTAPDLGTATLVHAAIALTAAVQTITTSITDPDFPRTISIKGNRATITGNVVITGTDIRDNVITDTIALNDATEVFGVKAFKTVTSIGLPVESTSGDTVSIGAGDSLGLDRIPAGNEALNGTADGAVEATLPVVSTSATIPTSLVVFNTALDGSADFVLNHIVTELTAKPHTTA